MTNQQLAEKINKIIQKELKERKKRGIRKYNEKNNGIWIMMTYRSGNKNPHKAPHLDIKNFVDNMSFSQMKRVCIDAGGKFYAYDKAEKGELEKVLKKKNESSKEEKK